MTSNNAPTIIILIVMQMLEEQLCRRPSLCCVCVVDRHAITAQLHIDQTHTAHEHTRVHMQIRHTTQAASDDDDDHNGDTARANVFTRYTIYRYTIVYILYIYSSALCGYGPWAYSRVCHIIIHCRMWCMVFDMG